MNYGASFFVCSIILLPSDVACFAFIRNFFFPRVPMVTKVRRTEDARVLGDEFAVLDTVGLVEQHGYPIEEHKVTTVDGYNISFFRISGSPVSPKREGKPLIFLQHGIFGSSDAWVLLGPGKDLAFLLADEGYDVWIGNIRGNSYGRSHIELSPQGREFWRFSFHEMAVRDLPRMIDHALEHTGQKALSYIGHSMGTTMAYILLSELPEYNDKMRLVVSLAPVAVWKNPPGLVIRLLAENGHIVMRIFDDSGIYEILPQTTNNVRLGRTLCSDNSLTQPACVTAYSILVGNDPEQFNSTLLPYVMSYFPAGGSTATLHHYQQNVVSGIFQKFDFGYVDNFRLYGKKKPPIYDMKKISAPIALIYGKNDPVSTEPNIDELSKRLQNVVAFEAVALDTFNHLDFLWAKDAKELLYDRVIELVTMYTR